MGSRPLQAVFDTPQHAPADTCDVLVIGAGCAGLQAGQAAALHGARVLILDRLGAEALESARQHALVLGGGDAPMHWRAGHTALELLLDETGAVRGAAGVSGAEETPWRIVAGAVLIASGDALLMAAEAGAELRGMERGEGGLHIDASSGASTVDGLYAAGAAAWSVGPRGTGLPRGTGALSLLSGQQAGMAAAGHARLHRQAPPGPLWPAGHAGLRGQRHRPASPQATLAALQAVLRRPIDSDDEAAAEALERLDSLWHFICAAAPAPQGALCATRAAACQLARARWQLRSRLARRASEADRFRLSLSKT